MVQAPTAELRSTTRDFERRWSQNIAEDPRLFLAHVSKNDSIFFLCGFLGTLTSEPELSKSEGTFRSVPTRQNQGPPRSDTRVQTERIQNGSCGVVPFLSKTDPKRVGTGRTQNGSKTDRT